MTDYTWPDDLVPFQMTFYRQQHNVVHTSPYTRQQQVLGRSAPRLVAKMSFRGGANERAGRMNSVGIRLEAFLEKVKGPQNRVLVYDFRLPNGRGVIRNFDDYAATVPETFFSDGTGFADGGGFVVTPVGAPATSGGAVGGTSIVMSGLWPGTTPRKAGDWIGFGDNRAYRVTDDATVDADGNAVIRFEPPLKSAVGPNSHVFTKVRAAFRLTTDDAGSNPTDVTGLGAYEIDLVEDL